MTELRRAPLPVLRKETVDVHSLGEVVVRMLKLSERLALGREVTAASAASHSDDLFIPRLLAMAVAYQSGEPLFTVEEWDIFAAENQADAGVLADVAMRLGGFGEAAAKNA